MKITERALREIILEEIENTLNEINKYHSASGKFSSKKNAKTVSLSNNAKKYLKDKSQAPVRGKVTASGAVSSKFGMNTGKAPSQCGRITFPDGKAKSPTLSCKDYNKRYSMNELLDDLLEELETASLIEEQGMQPDCKHAVSRWLQQVRLANMSLKSAGEGKNPKLESNTGSDEPRPKSHYRGSPVSPITRTSPAAKSSRRKRKWFRQIGHEVPKGGFSPEERSLTRADSLEE
jgi:hypothetical protein